MQNVYYVLEFDELVVLLSKPPKGTTSNDLLNLSWTGTFKVTAIWLGEL